jgi:hypothetical protein
MEMTYQLQGYEDRTAETGYDAERFADTLKDARKQAKYMLSDEYRNVCEASRLLTKVQIWKGEELVDEVYGKEG